ncbi:MAG: hypothetical protein RR202_12850 [Bacteroidales bacterium]
MKQKAILWLLVALFGGVAFWACDDNDDDDRNIVYQSFAYVSDLDETANTFNLITEKGNTLVPENPGGWVKNLSNGQWVLATFTINSQPSSTKYNIYLLALQEVTTKSIVKVDQDSLNSLYTNADPASVYEAWVVKGATNGYINMVFRSNWFSLPPVAELVQDTTAAQVSGVLNYTLIVDYNGGQLLPPQVKRYIISYMLPTTDLAGINTIKINFKGLNFNPGVYTITVGNTSTFAGDFMKDGTIEPSMLQLE